MRISTNAHFIKSFSISSIDGNEENEHHLVSSIDGTLLSQYHPPFNQRKQLAINQIFRSFP